MRNVLGLVNSSGVLTERYEYNPYGERKVFISAGTNDPQCYSPTTTSQKFVASGSVTQFYGLCEVGHQGLMHDEESGLIYNRARDNDTLLERFMEEDPAGYRYGLNLYDYLRDNPTDHLDSDGKGIVDCCEALAELAKATANLVRRTAEATNPDKGHIKALQQAEQRAQNALDKVMDHCGGTAAAALAIAAAQDAITAAQELYQEWQEAGEPIPVP